MIVNVLPVKDFCRYSLIQCILVDVCLIFFLSCLFSALLLLVQFSISFYLHVFILVLACFWFSMLRSHQVNLVFFFSLSWFSTSKIVANKQRSYKSTRVCMSDESVRRVESLFDYSMVWWSSFFCVLLVS